MKLAAVFYGKMARLSDKAHCPLRRTPAKHPAGLGLAGDCGMRGFDIFSGVADRGMEAECSPSRKGG